MKIFAVRDETDAGQKDLAYLFYYETGKKFYIELPDHADPWETPLLLSSFVKRGEKTVNPYWSRVWVQQRIVPPDRQNLAYILRDNGLAEYDEFALLTIAGGRCAQDDYYLLSIGENDLPEYIQERFLRRVEDVLALDEYVLLVFFRDGLVKKCHLKNYLEDHRELQILLKKTEFFPYVHVMVGGYGVTWDENRDIMDYALYEMGETVPLIASDFRRFVEDCVISAAQAAEILGCSRQNINDLTKRGKLHPVKNSEKGRFYLKSEVVKRSWQ